MSSVQRRFQRYRIIYIWKILAGLTHNFGIIWRKHPHRGTLIDIKQPKFYKVSNRALAVWRQSLAVNGASLFNAMPENVRNYEGKSLSGFKMTLDQTLETIPDCPPSQGLYPAPVNYITGRNSNCLLDWSRYLRLSGRCTLLGDDSEIVYSV